MFPLPIGLALAEVLLDLWPIGLRHHDQHDNGSDAVHHELVDENALAWLELLHGVKTSEGPDPTARPLIGSTTRGQAQAPGNHSA